MDKEKLQDIILDWLCKNSHMSYPIDDEFGEYPHLEMDIDSQYDISEKLSEYICKILWMKKQRK